jgi:glucose-1-phosphate cytidylyltransferase
MRRTGMRATAPRDVPVAVLCGGQGTRLGPLGWAKPKPLVEVGGTPIVTHVLHLYARHGFRRFVLCLGHRASDIRAYFQGTDNTNLEGCDVELVDTGTDANTGARVARVRDRLGDSTFAVTYADGIGPIDLAAELAFHQGHAAIGTVTGTHPRSPYGHLDLDRDVVRSFDEKPILRDAWVSAGFFCFEPEFLDYLDDDPVCALEAEPLRKLAADGELRVFRHDGLWQPMDTVADHVVLEDHWRRDDPLWKA